MGIVVYRYLLVCRAVYVHNHGEARVWRVVRNSVFLLSLLSGALAVHSWAKSYRFLLCSGKEEQFRWGGGKGVFNFPWVLNPWSDNHTFS